MTPSPPGSSNRRRHYTIGIQGNLVPIVFFDDGVDEPRLKLRATLLCTCDSMPWMARAYALYPTFSRGYPQLGGRERTACRQLNAQATGRLSVRWRTGYPQLIDGRTHRMSAGCLGGYAQNTDGLPTTRCTAHRQVADKQSTAWTHKVPTPYPQVVSTENPCVRATSTGCFDRQSMRLRDERVERRVYDPLIRIDAQQPRTFDAVMRLDMNQHVPQMR